ncbi:hypothetical protein ABFZ85_02595 [Hyphococcus formosus]|uniref:hypothetical protein n=1 Tax=Hyphococcus formosus TaxID=3143534 RepID=UPI00398B988A
MSVAAIISVSGLADFLSVNGTALVSGLFIGTLVFFIGSLVVAIMTLKASSHARSTLAEAEDLVAGLKSQMSEMRDLTGQVESAWQDLADRQAALSAQLKSHEPTPVAGNTSQLAPEPASNEQRTEDLDDKDLAAARSAATEPRSLLRGLLNRR